jgi:hypothetical protein
MDLLDPGRDLLTTAASCASKSGVAQYSRKAEYGGIDPVRKEQSCCSFGEDAVSRQIRNEIRSTFDSVEFDPLSIEGEVFPAPTEIVKHLGNVMGNEDLWLGHYHYLCGMANHPSLSVMEILTLNEFGIHEIDISPERLTQNVRATISPYLRSLLYICAYMRWPDLELRQLYDEISDE